MTIVDRDLGAPLHHQIYLVLADGIATGRYAAGEISDADYDHARQTLSKA